MFFVSQKRMRRHALAVAVAAAFSIVAVPALAADQINLSGLQSAEQHDRFIVKYKDDSSPRKNPAALATALDRAARAVPTTSGRTLDVVKLRRLAVGAEVIRTSRKLDRVEAEILMRQIANDPNVEYVEIDAINRPSFTPNDTYFSQQYGLGTGTGGIRATEAWDVENGSGTVVAVIDTGIVSHSDLNANVLSGYDFIADSEVSNDGNGRDSNPNDDFWGCPPDPENPGPYVDPQATPNGHGTHVAGIVAAVTNNSTGVAGVAYGAKVVPIRVLAECAGFDSDVADAIVWASGDSVGGVSNPNPAEAINLSLGRGGSCGTTFQNAINVAVSNGTTVVVSAGNGNTNVSNQAPANCGGVIAVAAIDSTGARSIFSGSYASNYGTGVDIAAPGSDVPSTYLDGDYDSFSGTSMAAPHVAGVVALMQAHANTPKTPSKIESLLKTSARDFPVTPSQTIGAGIVHAGEAVAVVNCVSSSTDFDFDCDGEADILWRNSSSGSNMLWPSGQENDEITLGSETSSWKVVGVGHFNDDTRADIVWRNSSNGQNKLWFSGNSSASRTLTQVSDQNWKVVGVGDFDGNGESDLLWRHSSDGSNSIWFSADSTDYMLPTTVSDQNWKIVGVGDFNGDGESDILWRHSGNGQNSLWYSGDSSAYFIPTAISDQNWIVASVGDFDGDGESDILWRNVSTGANSVWPSAVSPGYALTSANTSWTVEGVADFDDDGESDILWRHTNGQNSLWFSGDSTDSEVLETLSSSSWQIVP